MPWASLRYVLLTFFYLLPLILFGFGKTYAAVAALLLVALPFIKDRKLAAAIGELEAWQSQASARPLAVNEHARPQGRPDIIQRELDSLRAARRRWRALTLLPPLPEPLETLDS